jgi:glycosyltransferase involved in cell wall biosynthesis
MSISLHPKISGLVITLNEEKNIEAVINNLNFVDELIIVDSHSTDNTVAIIEKYPKVKLVQNTFENYTAQRNLALGFATNPWILFLDADERITPKLQTEILETVKNSKAAEAYFFVRKFMFQEKELHFSGWQTDKNIRLFKKDKARYIIGRLVHEQLKVEGKTAVLKHKLIHYSYLDYETYKSKMVNYGKLKAQELFAKNANPSLFLSYIKPVYKFFHSYFIRLGILDGKKGMIICYLNALSVAVRFSELKKLKSNPKK